MLEICWSSNITNNTGIGSTPIYPNMLGNMIQIMAYWSSGEGWRERHGGRGLVHVLNML